MLKERLVTRFTSNGKRYEIDNSLIVHTEPCSAIPDGMYLFLADGKQMTASQMEFIRVIEEAE
ncbi:hypothetical protein ACVSUJ_21510 [Yersinia enterocolitica]